MRRLNLVFLAILVVGLALFGGGMHLVHGIQVRRNASSLLDHARRDEANNQPAKAVEALQWYLSLRPDDGATWAWYARLVNQGDPERRQLERIYLVYQQALRHETGDRQLKRRCADLAMELGRHGDAQGLLTELREEAPADATAVERAEIEDLLGQCDRALGKHKEAWDQFDLAIKLDPHRVDAYDRLARLSRTELRQDDVASAKVQEMIAKNPESGRAHALRWRYEREFSPAADPKDKAKDIETALALAPDDREVLLAAAMASEQKQDLAAMRTYLEKGYRLDPKDFPFASSLARLETREGHLDRAEAVLRGSFEARPSVGLAFELAETLISQGKIEGKDGAAEMIAVLRRAGLGETVVRFLEAEVLFQGRKWTEAIAELETARAVLGAAPNLILRINLMLAECHGRLGSDEQRLEVLHRAAEGNRGAEVARLELVRVMAQSGQLDQAITSLTPMAIAGSNPEWRIELVRLLLQKTVRQPRDRRNWLEVEQRLSEVEKALPVEKASPQATEPIVLLRLDVLAAQDRLDDARALLTQTLTRDPRNLGYRLAMARLTQLQHRDDEALRIIDQAEKDLGHSPRINLARLDYWGQRGGDAARGELARLAAARGQMPDADRPAYLDRLGAVAIQLGRPDLARTFWRELAALRPDDIRVRLGLFDLALVAGDRDEPTRLIEDLREIEGETGSNWRFARAALLLDQARRGYSEGLDEARGLAADITERRPSWWVGPSLNGEIAQLAGSVDQAIAHYLRALELGNMQPSFARRLVLLLDRQGRHAEVNRVTQVLSDQGAALAEVTLVQALDAIRKRDYDRGIALAHQVFAENSPNAADHLNLGRIYQAAGRANEAGREFRRAVELGRGVPENWLAYVQHLVQAKQPDQAKAVVEAAAKALPADRATVPLAQCAIILGDTAQAETLIKRALDAEGKADDLATLQIAVAVNLQLKNFEAARTCLDRIASSPTATPGDKAWANRTRAAILLATNRPTDRDQAIALVDRNLADVPDNAEDQSLKAAILAFRPAGRGEAIAILERLAGTNRLGDDQRFLLAQLHLGQGAEAKYEDEMLGLLNRKDKDPRHLAHFVNHWIDRNQLDQADRWLAELKQADPRGRPALEMEARLLDVRKRRPELLALLEARGRDVPDEIGAVADLLNRYGFAKEAEAAYKAYIARDPKQPERVLALAQFLARQDRVSEAMAILKKAWSTCRIEQVANAALSLHEAPSAGEAEKRQIEAWLAEAVQRRPDAVGLAAKLGVIWLYRDRPDDAESLFRRILGGNPDDPEVLNDLAWLLALRDNGRAREALGLIEHAIDVQGPTPMLLDTRAVVCIRAGQLERAVQDLTELQVHDPARPGLARHLAWAYQTMGRTEDARKVIQKAGEGGWKLANSDPLERAFMERLRKELGLGGT